MRSWPKGVAELDRNNRWTIESYLQLIEEFACDPEAFGTGGPGREETAERIRQAVKRMDSEAEDKAIRDGMRVQTSELWWDFPELQLLGKHFGRAALRKAGRGSPGCTDPPSRGEGLLLARELLAHIPGRSLRAQTMGGADRLDLEWESEAVSSALADQWLFPIEARARPLLREYIRLSSSNPVYFDALWRIWEELNSRGEAIRLLLARWRQEVESGRLERPPSKPTPAHRPVTLPKYLSDLNVQLTIEILRRIGIPPEGSSVSGCEIVSDALETSEDPALRLSDETVRRIWQKRIWNRPFEPVVVKYSKAIAKRHGPFHTTRA